MTDEKPDIAHVLAVDRAHVALEAWRKFLGKKTLNVLGGGERHQVERLISDLLHLGEGWTPSQGAEHTLQRALRTYGYDCKQAD